MAVTGGSELSFIGTTISDASKAGSGKHPAIDLSGGDHIQIQQSAIGTMLGEKKRCSYGLAIGSGVTYLLATGNQFQACTAGDVANAGGATVHVVNNLKSDGSYN